MEESTSPAQPEQKVEATDNSEAKQPKEKRNLPKPAIKKTLLVILALAGLGAGVYFGYKYIKRVDMDIADVKSRTGIVVARVDDLSQASSLNNSRIDSIISQQTTAQNNYSYPAPEFADITVEKVLEDKNTALESGFRFLLVDVKLVNNSSNDIYFSASELKLKDKEDYDYGFYSNNPYGVNYIKKDTNVLFPDNRLPLDYASLKPRETVKGTIVYVINRASTKFTLYRNGVVLKDISL